MSQWLKQSTAATIALGPFVDSTDGATAETGLTISQADIRLSKNGGAFAQTNNATGATHMENGHYSVPLDTTDTNTLGRLKVAVNESGALPVWQEFHVVPANVWDSFFGADKLQVHADEITAGLITAAAVATGAIDADALAADAVAEIADGVLDEALSGHTTAGSLGKAIADIETDATAILADTGTDGVVVASGSKSGYSLSASQTFNMTGDITGNLSGSVGSVTGAVGSVTGNVGGNVTGSVGSLAAQAKADVNAEVVDALATDTYAEPGQGAPAATATLAAKINYLYKNWRNKKTQTADTFTLFADDGSTADQKSTVSDDGTTATRGEMATGA